MTRVVQVIVTNQRRGAETFAVDLGTELKRRGIAAVTVALAATASAHALSVEALGRRALSPGTMLALRGIVTSGTVSAVIAHGSRTLLACAIALAGTGIPFVYRSIGDPRVWSSRGLRRWRTGALLSRAARVAVVWPGAADAYTSLHRLPAGKIRVIPNGVPAQRCPVPDESSRRQARSQFGLPVDAPVVGYVGSLTPEKCVGAAVAAVGGLPGVHLVVAGDGPLRSDLEAQADVVAPGRVRFVGVVLGSAPVLAASNAIVLPSRTEGMPGVLVEAGMSGLPVVATDVGGVSEIVADGSTGMLVAHGDTAALTAGLERVLADDGAMGQAARDRCLARFEIGAIGDAWGRLLAEVTPALRT